VGHAKRGWPVTPHKLKINIDLASCGISPDKTVQITCASFSTRQGVRIFLVPLVSAGAPGSGPCAAFLSAFH
jgi:hypothetical protein